MSDLQCVVVTPEQTELDVQAVSVNVPMFDGEMGILKGHSPMVGRLGYGALRVNTGSEVKSYFVEGGFVQVADNVVSVLTDKLVPTSEITSAAAQEALQAALDLPGGQLENQIAREKSLSRARAMTRLAAS